MRPRFLFDFPSADGTHRPLAFGPAREICVATNPADTRSVLRRVERAALDGAWVAGLVTYEAAPAFEPASRVRKGSALPLAWFGVFDAPLADPQLPETSTFTVSPWQASNDRARYNANIATIRDAIGRGDTYQVNYTFRLQSNFTGDDLVWFDHLRAAQPKGYCAYLDIGRHRILSASPELFFRRDGDRLTSKPMKGTAPRGDSPYQDERLAKWLFHSVKNRAENAMIVDVLRNDLSRVALPHSVRVPALFSIERYPTVLQMTSTVTAQARPGTTLDEIFAALFPCASITGAPKIKAMEIIAQLESAAREMYCGAIGLIAPGGDAVFNVAIRTVVLDTATGEATCGVGGGITWDSTATDEYEEALLKSRFLHGAPSRNSRRLKRAVHG